MFEVVIQLLEGLKVEIQYLKDKHSSSPIRFSSSPAEHALPHFSSPEHDHSGGEHEDFPMGSPDPYNEESEVPPTKDTLL